MDGSGRRDPEYVVRPRGAISRLILSRTVNEAILIDGGIRIVVVKIERNKVRIAIEAPNETCIVREEIIKELRK